MTELPKRELRCHPLVVMRLREETWRAPASRSRLWNYYDLNPCPVYEDPSMEPGAWEMREDGIAVASGNTEGRE